MAAYRRREFLDYRINKNSYSKEFSQGNLLVWSPAGQLIPNVFKIFAFVLKEWP